MPQPDPIFPPGTPVTYWGQARQNSLYGADGVVDWANVCNCAHQTYAVSFTLADGTTVSLSKVLGASLRVRETDNG